MKKEGKNEKRKKENKRKRKIEVNTYNFTDCLVVWNHGEPSILFLILAEVFDPTSWSESFWKVVVRKLSLESEMKVVRK